MARLRRLRRQLVRRVGPEEVAATLTAVVVVTVAVGIVMLAGLGS